MLLGPQVSDAVAEVPIFQEQKEYEGILKFSAANGTRLLPMEGNS